MGRKIKAAVEFAVGYAIGFLISILVILAFCGPVVTLTMLVLKLCSLVLVDWIWVFVPVLYSAFMLVCWLLMLIWVWLWSDEP